jgi:hypothetical protein
MVEKLLTRSQKFHGVTKLQITKNKNANDITKLVEELFPDLEVLEMPRNTTRVVIDKLLCICYKDFTILNYNHSKFKKIKLLESEINLDNVSIHEFGSHIYYVIDETIDFSAFKIE